MNHSCVGPPPPPIGIYWLLCRVSPTPTHAPPLLTPHLIGPLVRLSPSTPRQLVKQMRSGDVDLRKAVLIGSREAEVAIEGLRVTK